MKLNRMQLDVSWRDIAGNSGVAPDIAQRLWARAESTVSNINDVKQVESMFRRMLAELKGLNDLADELEGGSDTLRQPGKWTRVLLQDQKHAGSASSRTSSVPKRTDAPVTPAIRLRQALQNAVTTGEQAARSVAGANASMITQVLARIRDGQVGNVLATLDPGALSQIMRLADGLVTVIDQGRNPTSGTQTSGNPNGGTALPGELRNQLESRLNADFGNVRIHDDASAADQARQHGAVAFAQGSDVFFGEGKYDPSSNEGKHLLAHELTHVAQQSGGAPAAAGAMSEVGSAVELEADRVADAFVAGADPGDAAFKVSEHVDAGTISRRAVGEPAPAASAAPAAPAVPKEWKLSLLGQALDLSARLSGATDIGGGEKQIVVNQKLGPLRIQSATFKADGEKISSGTLLAAIDSGPLKGTAGELTVNARGQVSGSLEFPLNVPGLMVKKVKLEIGAGRLSTTIRLEPKDFNSPKFSIKSSSFDLTITSDASGLNANLVGSAVVGIENGIARGEAKIEIDLQVGRTITFTATITGKIEIVGLAAADAVITYDGKTFEFEAGGNVAVNLPGLAGTANIHYAQGKLSVDSEDLHFTLPQLAGVNFERVNVGNSKLGARFSLGRPINIPLPGGASIILNKSSVLIDGGIVGGDLDGSFAFEGLTGNVKLNYERGGDFGGTVTLGGNKTIAGVNVAIDSGSTLTVAKGLGVTGSVGGAIKIPGLPQVGVKVDALAGQPLTITADLREAAPIQLGTFATLTIAPASTVTLTKGSGLVANLAGSLDAKSIGTGTFNIKYEGKKLSGSANVNTKPFAMFAGVKVDLTMNENRQVSTNAPIVLALAPTYSTMFGAEASVTILNNRFDVTGRVSEVKQLGKISDAFKNGPGATITYENGQVTMAAGVELGGVVDGLASGSLLKMTYANNVVSLAGALKPKQYGPVTFTPDSQLTARWNSSDKQFVVAGEAHADIAGLCKADFSVDASRGGGLPGVFALKGKLDATTLAQKTGINFSSVTADFAVLIGQGQKADLSFQLRAAVAGIRGAGITDINAHVEANYKSGEGLSGELAVTRAKLGEVIADGSIKVANNKFASGNLHMVADLPSLKIEGTAVVAPGDMGKLTTKADLKVTPGGDSALSKIISSGNIHIDIVNWKLTNALGQLRLTPPSFLPLENTVIEVGYKPDAGLHAVLKTQFNAPMAKNGEKGTFEAGFRQGRGLFAHLEIPITVPGFQAATVKGDLDSKGLRAGVTLIPKNPGVLKQATVEVGYEPGGGFFVQGLVTLKPSEELELEVGVRYQQGKGLQVLGITPKDKNATDEEHEVAKWDKKFPTIPLATVGVASLGLKFGISVGAGYRMPKIKFENPQLEGGLDALESGGMPAFTFGGQIAMGAYIAMSMSVQIVGEIQLLIATASVGIGAEIAARLNLELGANVKGRFAPGQGAQLEIDPFVNASLDVIASLIATLYAEVCWFTVIDKKWKLASVNLAHINLGSFRPFKPVGLQFGGPGGTKLTQGLALREDAFGQIIDGVKEGGKTAGDEEANRDSRERVSPVLQAFKSAAVQFEELPTGWENGMTAVPVNFESMVSVGKKEWDFYQDHADTAEQVAPGLAMRTPTERLAKAVGVTARKDPTGAGQLVLAWRRAQIAHKGINPDTGVNVVEERAMLQAQIIAKYQADVAAAQAQQQAQDAAHQAAVVKQGRDYQAADVSYKQRLNVQTTTHQQAIAKTQTSYSKAQEQKAAAAAKAQQAGAKVQGVAQQKAPPPPAPVVVAAPVGLTKPAALLVPAKVPLPLPADVLPQITLPALPSDPAGMVRASAPAAPAKKQVAPESPGVKAAPVGGAPNPTPGVASNAKQAGGGGGGAMPGGSSGSGGKAPTGGATTAAPRPGPAVTAGPTGIISQNKTLDAKKSAMGGGTPVAGGKPGALGKLPAGAPASAAAPASALSTGGKPATTAAANGASTAAGPAGKPGVLGKPATGGAVDPSVQKVIDQGKAAEAAQKQKLAAQSQGYSSNVAQKTAATAAETKSLDKAAEEAKKKKELEKAAAAKAAADKAAADKVAADKAAAAKAAADKVAADKAAADKAAATAAGGKSGAAGALGPDGKPVALGPDGKPVALGPDGKPVVAPRKKVGIRVPFTGGGETHHQYIELNGGTAVAMMASTPAPVTSQIAGWRAQLQKLSTAEQQKAGALIGKAVAVERVVTSLAKAAVTDPTQDGALAAKQQELALALAAVVELITPQADSNKAKPPLTYDAYATHIKLKFAEQLKQLDALAAQAKLNGGDVRRKHEGYKVTLEAISQLKAELDAAKATLDRKKAELAQAKLDAAVANQDQTMAQLLAKAQQLCRDIKAKGDLAKDEKYALEGVMQISLKLATQLDPEATKTGRGLYVTLDETENPALIKQGRDAGMVEAAVAQMAVDQRNWLRKLWRSEVMKDQTNAEILYLRDLGLQGSRDGMTLQQVIAKVIKGLQNVDAKTQQAALANDFKFENATPEQLTLIYKGVIGSAGQTNAGVNNSTGVKKDEAKVSLDTASSVAPKVDLAEEAKKKAALEAKAVESTTVEKATVELDAKPKSAISQFGGMTAADFSGVNDPLLAQIRALAEADNARVANAIKVELAKAGVKHVEMQFRAKSVKSILGKLQETPGMTIGKIRDLSGIRANITTVDQAEFKQWNQVVEIIKKLLQIEASEIKDYNAKPNPRGYTGRVHAFSTSKDEVISEIQVGSVELSEFIEKKFTLPDGGKIELHDLTGFKAELYGIALPKSLEDQYWSLQGEITATHKSGKNVSDTPALKSKIANYYAAVQGVLNALPKKVETPTTQPVTMNGEAHNLIATGGKTPKIELHSKPGEVKVKVAAALAKARSQTPIDEKLITDLNAIAQASNQLETLLTTNNGATPTPATPTNKPQIDAAMQRLKSLVAQFGVHHKTTDLEAPAVDELKSPHGKPAKDGTIERAAPPLLQLYGYSGVRKIHGRLVKDIEAEFKSLENAVPEYAARRAELAATLKKVDEKKRNDYLIFAGHVGISVDHGTKIYGLTPLAPEGMKREQVIAHLHNHTMTFPGQVKNDKHHFDFAIECANELGWDTDVVTAMRPITTVREAEIKDELERLEGMIAGTHGIYYSFPLSDAVEGKYFVDTPGPNGKIVKGEAQAVCSTFPAKIGIELPEQSGNIRYFMPALRHEASDGEKSKK